MREYQIDKAIRQTLLSVKNRIHYAECMQEIRLHGYCVIVPATQRAYRLRSSGFCSTRSIFSFVALYLDYIISEAEPVFQISDLSCCLYMTDKSKIPINLKRTQTANKSSAFCWLGTPQGNAAAAGVDLCRLHLKGEDTSGTSTPIIMFSRLAKPQTANVLGQLVKNFSTTNAVSFSSTGILSFLR